VPHTYEEPRDRFTMPREKLLTEGVEALSVSELLAIVFNTGYRGESVLQLADRLLQEYGSQSLPDQRNVRAVQQETGLPLVKSCQLVACFELGRRYFDRQPHERSSRPVRSPRDVYEHLREMTTLRKEQLRGLYLNVRNVIIHEETISIGTMNSNLVHPVEVFRPAVEHSAVGVIIAHNHPSGEPEPSDEDLAITAQLAQAASLLNISLLDHVIVAENGFKSLREMGVL
jgi:DNA repair protein RadC